MQQDLLLVVQQEQELLGVTTAGTSTMYSTSHLQVQRLLLRDRPTFTCAQTITYFLSWTILALACFVALVVIVVWTMVKNRDMKTRLSLGADRWDAKAAQWHGHLCPAQVPGHYFYNTVDGALQDVEEQVVGKDVGNEFNYHESDVIRPSNPKVVSVSPGRSSTDNFFETEKTIVTDPKTGRHTLDKKIGIRSAVHEFQYAR